MGLAILHKPLKKWYYFSIDEHSVNMLFFIGNQSWEISLGENSEQIRILQSLAAIFRSKELTASVKACITVKGSIKQ